MKINYVTIKPYIAWYLSVSFVFFQFFLQSSSSVMSASWMLTFHLNTIQLSNLSASFFYPYVLMQIPVGVLYDRFKTKKILVIAGIVLSIGCFILAEARSYEVAIIGRILMGIGSAFGFIGMLKVIINNFSASRFVLMVGISDTIAMTIVAFSIIILAQILRVYSWEHVMFAFGVYALLLVVAIMLLMDDSKEMLLRNTDSFVQIVVQVGKLLIHKQFIFCSIYCFFMFAIINVFVSLWGIEFFTHTYFFTRELSSSMVSMVFIGVSIGAPVNGLLSKRFNNHTRMMIIGGFFSTFTTCLIILVPNLSILWIWITLFFAGIWCSIYLQGLAVIKDSVKPEIQGMSLATANSIIMMSAPLLQVVVGVLLNNHFFGLAKSNISNYRLALSILPLGMFIAFIISFFVKEPSKRVVVHNI